MADELREGPNVLRVPFLFVKHGDTPPLDWMARHPGWVKFPAVMIPRNSPEHPANGGKYPTFPRQPPGQAATAAVPVSDAEKWPFGRPASDTLRGPSSRITPGNPPLYPGGLGAPPGPYPGQGEDPVTVYLRINAMFEDMGATPRQQRPIAPDPISEPAPLLRDQPPYGVATATLDGATDGLVPTNSPETKTDATTPAEPAAQGNSLWAEVARALRVLDPIGTADAAGTKQKLTSDPAATGDHTVFRRAPDGSIQNYETYQKNPVTGGYDPLLRFRGRGKPHDEVEPPFVLERDEGKGPGSTPNVARPARPTEIPRFVAPPPVVEPVAPELPEIVIPDIILP